MPALLPPTCLSLYATLDYFIFLIGHCTPTIPKNKLHFTSPAMKSNVNRHFFETE